MKGKLYVCSTPIGNMGDITLRALETLRGVGLIAAEDTRHTQKLLNSYDIKTPTTSYYEHNKVEKTPYLVNQLLEGKDVALVSDAGTPGISDPGELLIQEAIKAGIQVVPIPGPSAFLAALTVSGLSTARFHFEGFVPRRKKERREFWENRREEIGTFVFYESPHRLLSSLRDMYEVLGNRKIAVAREITKHYEETFRGTVLEAVDHFREGIIKGEFVVVVEGASEHDSRIQKERICPKDEEAIRAEIERLMREGMSKKEAIKYLVQREGLSRKTVYQAATAIEANPGNR